MGAERVTSGMSRLAGVRHMMRRAARRDVMRPWMRAIAPSAALLLLAVTAQTGGADSITSIGSRENLSMSIGLASMNPATAITIDDDTGEATIHVVWEEDTDLVHRWRELQGGEWSAKRKIYYFGQDPTLTAMGETLVLGFMKTPAYPEELSEILLASWKDGAWEPIPVKTKGGTLISENGQQPDIDLDPTDGTLWLTWIDASGGTLTPKWAHLDATFRVTSSDLLVVSDSVQSPSISVGTEGTVWAAWSERFASGDETIYLNSRPPGSTWRSDPRGVNEGERGRLPDVSASRDDVCVAWQETVGESDANQEIYLDCESADRQYNHSDTVGGRSLQPSLALDDEMGALVVWQERLTRSEREIEARQGPPPSERLMVDNGAAVQSPSVVLHDGVAHSAWVVGDGDDAEVHYANWELSGPPPTATATPTRTATRTATRTPRPTNTATATSVVPSATPEATVTPGTPGTPTATPSVTVTPDRPLHFIYLPYAENDVAVVFP